MRALVLAAGLGTRLRPLTNHLPKPLLPVASPGGGITTVAGASLASLARAGCAAAALNLHWLPEQIEAHFGAEQFGMPLFHSREEEILGTLGALHPLRGFLAAGGEEFLLVNGDSLCDWPLEEMLAKHRQSGAEATLLTLSAPADARLGGGLGLGDDGSVVQLRQMPAAGKVATRRDFAGCHVIASRLLREVPKGPGDILEGLYQKVLERGGRIATVANDRSWHDLGDPRRYLEAVGEGAISPLAEIAGAVERSVVERGAKVEEGARVASSILCAGARVGKGARVERSILGLGAELAAGAVLEDAVLTRGAQVLQLIRSGSSP